MNNEQHTPEPWMAIESEEKRLDTIVSGPVRVAVLYCDGFNFEPNNQEANARRIVACVNACAGMDTEQLIFYGKGYANTLEILVGNLREENIRLRREKAELLNIVTGGEGAGEIAKRLKEERDSVIVDKMALMMERDRLRREANKQPINALQIAKHFELEFDSVTGKSIIHKDEVEKIQNEIYRLQLKSDELAQALSDAMNALTPNP